MDYRAKSLSAEFLEQLHATYSSLATTIAITTSKSVNENLSEVDGVSIATSIPYYVPTPWAVAGRGAREVHVMYNVYTVHEHVYWHTGRLKCPSIL